MHILGLIVGVAGVALVVLWRVHQASNAAREIGEVVDDAHGRIRRWSWRRKASVDQLRQVDDSRVAGAIMMVAVAEYDGALTDAELQVIQREITQRFGVNASQADELVAYARWLNKGNGDIGTVFLKLLPTIQRTCDRQQRKDLIGMLANVHAVSGDSEVPADQISQLEAKLRS